MTKILVLLGHPDTSTEPLSRRVADAYENAAQGAGHEVRRVNLGELSFDPVLHRGYRAIQELEPDLKKVQEHITWCEHFVVVHPVWWASMPAELKGLFDRIWIPSFAYRYRRNKDGSRSLLWDKLLAGRTARVITLSGSHPLFLWFLQGRFTNTISWILRFGGIRPRITCFGPSETSSESTRLRWLARVERLARKAR